jgi:hypothetical protein
MTLVSKLSIQLDPPFFFDRLGSQTMPVIGLAHGSHHSSTYEFHYTEMKNHINLQKSKSMAT